MAILDLSFKREMIFTIEDYGTLIGSVLNLNIPFTIVQYNLTERGIVLRISVPDEKLREVMAILKKNHIRIQNSTITINEDLCVHCGGCISLCNTGALYFGSEKERCFDEKKCIGCKICLDACPRGAISFE